MLENFSHIVYVRAKYIVWLILGLLRSGKCGWGDMVRSDEMGCLSRSKASCTAEINESKAEIKSTVEGHSRFTRLIVGARITGIIVVPQNVCAMDILYVTNQRMVRGRQMYKHRGQHHFRA